MGAAPEQWGQTMGNVGKMRTAVAALEAAVRKATAPQPSSTDRAAAQLTELRQWRLESSCRYVGKSIELAKRGGK
jgi:hypothetical protein